MVKIEKIKTSSTHFVFFLTLFFFISCSSRKNTLYEIKGSQTNINPDFDSNKKIEDFILPYRNHIEKDLDSVLAFSPLTLEKKKDVWETNIGNLMAKITYDLCNPVFESREGKEIDFCLLNNGGIRAIIPEGDVTARTAYNVMPFENSAMVVGLTGKEVFDLADYYLAEMKPHPLYGISIYTNSDYTKVLDIMIQGKPIALNKVYYVVTNDYLANGGDKMNFLKKSTIKYELDYKIRNILIDYFKSVDTLPNITTQHIIVK